MAQPSLLLLDGEHRNALGIVRRLGAAGIPVFVGGSHRLARSCFSRYCTRRFIYPSPCDDPESAHASVMEKLATWRPDVLLPAMDDGWKLVYAHQDLYAKHTTIVPCPGESLFAAMTDKAVMTTYALDHDIPVPATFQPASMSEARGLGGGLPYPVLLKPAVNSAGAGIRLARSPKEFVASLQSFDAVPIIQEFIEGEDLELTLLFNHGQPVAGSVYLSLRNYPLPFGPPVACRTIEDEGLMQIGIKLLRSLNYHGVAHLDFRRDRRDGVPKLLDFNSRLAGTDEISARSGVDFAFLLYKLALGEHPDPCFSYETGLEFRWVLFGEVRHALCTPHKRQTLGHLSRWSGIQTNLSISDPFPHIAHVLSVFRNSESVW